MTRAEQVSASDRAVALAECESIREAVQPPALTPERRADLQRWGVKVEHVRTGYRATWRGRPLSDTLDTEAACWQVANAQLADAHRDPDPDASLARYRERRNTP